MRVGALSARELKGGGLENCKHVMHQLVQQILTFDNKAFYTLAQSLQHCPQNVSMHNNLPIYALANGKKSCKEANRSLVL